jgi:hypothetical protein
VALSSAQSFTLRTRVGDGEPVVSKPRVGKTSETVVRCDFELLD